MTRFLCIVSIFACTLASTIGRAQTLFTIGKQAVDKKEFLRAFSKNNADSAWNEKNCRDYLNLFIRFKLKVRAALAEKLDSLPQQIQELESFSEQVADSYMNDEASLQKLVNQAQERSWKEINLGHIFIEAPKSADPSAIERARARANQLFEELKKGSRFEQLAQVYSNDPEVTKNKGHIGFVSVFVLPYEMENLVYSLAPDQVSTPYQSSKGFHIFKNLGERKSFGSIKVAQILFAFPPDASEQQQVEVGQLADSVYQLLKSGANFNQMVSQYSLDNQTNLNEGLMPEFSAGTYDPEFEKAAYALSKDGELSPPVRTAFGYHILQKIGSNKVSESEATKKELFRKRTLESDRISISKSIFNEHIKKIISFKQAPIPIKEFLAFSDSILQGKSKPALKGIIQDTEIFSFKGKSVLFSNWVDYLQALSIADRNQTKKTSAQVYQQYIETTASQYYRENLEKFNPDFASQIREFKEGNLLFEIMQRKIWDVASQDSAGLRYFYDHLTDKNHYRWQSSVQALILTANSDSMAALAIATLKQEPLEWRKLLDLNNGSLFGDSSRYEISQLPIVSGQTLLPNTITKAIKNETDNSQTFCYIFSVVKDNSVRSFEEAKGAIINDYQNYLEENWIRSLKKEYPVIINDSVLNQLIREKARK